MIRRKIFMGLGGILCAALLFCQLPEGTALEVNAAAKKSNSSAVKKGAGTAYDLILFYGQSNMVGEASHANTLFGSTGAAQKKAAADTDIDLDLIQNTSDCATTKIVQQDQTAYWYSLTDDALYELAPEMPIGTTVGGFTAVVLDDGSGQWVTTDSLDGTQAAQWYSDQINMIPEFAHAWYLLTGHRVIALDCAVGGVPIQAFLPMDDPDYQAPLEGSIVQYADLYQGVVDSVQGAQKAAAQNGWKIAGKYFVSFQGEGNIYDPNYLKDYRRVNANWRSLGFTDGALVETAFANNTAKGYDGVMQMHDWQKALVAEDNALVLGSSFAFDHYVPDAGHYNTYWKKKWDGVSWKKALALGHLVTDSDVDDLIHLNSAALSQIGREAARNLAGKVR